METNKIITRSILQVFAITIIAGCSEIVQDDVFSRRNILESAEIIGTSIENASATQTKTSLERNSADGCYDVKWSKGDKVTVISSHKKDNSFTTEYSTYKVELTSGVLNCMDTAPKTEDAYWFKAFYPYSTKIESYSDCTDPDKPVFVTTLPSSQNYSKDSFGIGAYPMVATSYGPEHSSFDSGNVFPFFGFSGTCGILRLNLTGSDGAVITKITISSATKGLSGKFALSGNVYEYAGAGSTKDKSVTLTCSEGVKLKTDSPTAFNIVLPVGEYNDLTIKVEAENGRYSTFKLKSDKVLPIARARFSDLNLTVKKLANYSIADEEIMTFNELEENLSIDYPMHYLFTFGNLVDVKGYSGMKENGRCYKAVKFNYPSVDLNGDPITLSGRLYFSCKTNGKIMNPEHIVVSHHFTAGSNAECPTGTYTIDCGMTFNKGLIVIPDLIGYGISSDKDHPYMCYEITAVNSLDMLRAAKDYMIDLGATNISNDIPVYSVGYSQGGTSALGFHKYIDTHPELRQEVNLVNTYCGGGVYSISAFFEKFVNDNFCTYPAGIPMMILGLKAVSPEILTEPVSAYLSEGLANSNIFDVIRAKTNTMDAINQSICDALGLDNEIDELEMEYLVSPDVMNKGRLYEQIMAAARKNDVIDGWTPTSSIHFFHYTNDNIVTYEMMNTAKKTFGTGSMFTYEDIDYESASFGLLTNHKTYAALFYARAASGEYLR